MKGNKKSTFSSNGSSETYYWNVYWARKIEAFKIFFSADLNWVIVLLLQLLSEYICIIFPISKFRRFPNDPFGFIVGCEFWMKFRSFAIFLMCSNHPNFWLFANLLLSKLTSNKRGLLPFNFVIPNGQLILVVDCKCKFRTHM